MNVSVVRQKYRSVNVYGAGYALHVLCWSLTWWSNTPKALIVDSKYVIWFINKSVCSSDYILPRTHASEIINFPYNPSTLSNIFYNILANITILPSACESQSIQFIEFKKLLWNCNLNYTLYEASTLIIIFKVYYNAHIVKTLENCWTETFPTHKWRMFSFLLEK